MLNPHALTEPVSQAIEVIGLATIVLGGIWSFLRALGRIRAKGNEVYKGLRRDLGRSILLSLELLVAADIVATVTRDATMESLTLLGMVVLIRTFLSFSLEVEIDGHWPWQGKKLEHLEKRKEVSAQ